MHVFAQCSYAKRVWKLVAIWTQRNALDPAQGDAPHWWSLRRLSEPTASRTGQASLIVLVLWQI